MVYHFGKRPSRSPMLISWNITGKCNARCFFCHYGTELYKGELTKEAKLKLVRELGRIRPWHLSLSGGEPLLCNDFEEIISLCSKESLNMSLCTNGFLLKDKAQFIVDKGVQITTVSVDSDSSSEHDAYRGAQGLFDSLIQGVETFKSVRKNKSTSLKVRILIHAKNIKRLDQIITFWKERVDEVLLQPISFHEAPHYRNKVSELINFEEIDLNALNGVLKKHGLDSVNNRAIINYLRGSNTEIKKCYGPAFFLHIDPNGDIWNCTDRRMRIGSLTEKAIGEWLHSEEFFEILKKMKSGVTCDCGYNCAMINSYLRKYDFLDHRVK